MEHTNGLQAYARHRDLGRVTLELHGGLLAIHYAQPGLVGSYYFPATACSLDLDEGGARAVLRAACESRSSRFELTPLSQDDFPPIAEALTTAIDESAVPRRPVQLEHEWPHATPWQSVRRLCRQMTRASSLAWLAVPIVAPYAWLKLRHEARQHEQGALEGFQHYARDHFDAARQALLVALERQPEDYDAFYLLLHTYLRALDFDGALHCAVELGMESKLRASHLDNDIRLLQGWQAHRHEPLYYRETKDREGIGLIGRQGEALTMLRPAGKVRIDGRILSARTQGGYASAGESVTVIGWDGVSVIVEGDEGEGIE